MLSREYDLLVLTPPPYGPRPFYRRQMSIWRRRLMGQPVSRYGGHPGVTRSLVEGLRGESRLNWKYITHYSGQTAKVLHVVADPTFVEIGIQAKRKGLCDRLIVGPNITVFPHEHDRVQTHPEIDCLIVPSDSMMPIYELDEPSLKGRMSSWLAGVDLGYWTAPPQRGSRILVYAKRRPDDARAAVEALRKAGLDAFELVYGKHKLQEYRAALADSKAAVILTDGESQGIAMFEAWAMNVPTFVNSHAREMMSPSPYLSEATGAFWSEPQELVALLREGSGSYRPRDWILEHGTDEISARILLTIAGLAVPGEEVVNAPSNAMPVRKSVIA